MSEKIEETQEEEDNLITLVDEDGEETQFYHVGTVELRGKTYCVFQLAEPQTEEEEDEVAIYELVGDELQPIEDEAEMEEVFNRFLDEYERYEEEEDAN